MNYKTIVFSFVCMSLSSQLFASAKAPSTGAHSISLDLNITTTACYGDSKGDLSPISVTNPRLDDFYKLALKSLVEEERVPSIDRFDQLKAQYAKNGNTDAKAFSLAVAQYNKELLGNVFEVFTGVNS